jgi:AbrB family looped-hinge helix DNA binding protein
MLIDRRTTQMGNTATLSSKYQISIPKKVREEQNWKPGQEFAFVPAGESVMLVPVPTLKELRGIARGANTQDYRDRNDRY